METRKSRREKEARRRRLSEKIGAALMAGSLAWTPGGPLSWAVVLGGGIAISQQGTAYAQEAPLVVDADTSGNVDATSNGGTVTVSAADGSTTHPSINNGNGTVYGIKNTTAGGTAQSASVTIDTGKMEGVYGGYVESGGTVTSNSVTVNDGSIGDGIWGGYVDGDCTDPSPTGGTASANTVTIHGGTIGSTSGYGNVYGGYTYWGTADGNQVIMDGGTVNGEIAGGLVEDSSAGTPAIATNNRVTIDHSAADGGTTTVKNYIAGGETLNDEGVTGDIISGNQVTIKETSGHTAVEEVYGGRAQYGMVSANTIIISGGTIGPATGGLTGSGTAQANTVTMYGGTAGSLTGGDVAGSGTAISNTITMYGGTAGSLDGGYVRSGTAISNRVIISGGTIGSAGASDEIIGGRAGSGSATSNSVIISGGTITGDIIGGYVSSGSATSNTVTLYGGTIVNGILYGGYSLTSGDDVTTGNTLNIGDALNRVSGLSAVNIANFQNLNFYLPGSITSGASVLTLSAAADTILGSSGANANISAYIDAGTTLASGDKVYLINKTGTGTLTAWTGGTARTSGTLGTANVYSGITSTLSTTIGIEDNDLVATVTHTGSTLPEQTKSLTETRAGGAAFLNGGGDMLAGQGMAAAVNAALDSGNSGSAPGGSTPPEAAAPADGTSQGSSQGGDGDRLAQTASGAADRAHYTLYVPFAAAGGNSMRYHTGSYVDSHGWNATLGFARAFIRNGRTLTFGPLIEHGRSRYDSYLDDGTHGSGNTRYTGAGVLARVDLTDGVYYEGSLRAGRIHSDYNGLLHAGGDSSAPFISEHYDTDSAYYALHLGLGKVMRLSQANDLDVYGKYFFSHEGSDTVHVSTGETFQFSSINSQRLRLGARFSHHVNQLSTFYAGTALEYEFDAESRATYKGAATPSPSMKGMSGMLELGWRMKPDAHSPLTIDLGAGYWTGKQQGVSLTAQFQWMW